MKKSICFCVPSLVSEFADSFVDLVVGGQLLGCETKFPPIDQGWSQHYPESNLRRPQPMVSRMSKVQRLVAIGDLHGDLQKAKEALLLARVMDRRGKWVGGKDVVVQVGDLLDRGENEIKIIYLLEKLKREAQREGGDVMVLNGNHEFMNAGLVFQCASRGGCEEFDGWKEWYEIGEAFKRTCDHTMYNKPRPITDKKIDPLLWCRIEALRPGGPFARRFFVNHPVVLVVGNSVFAHAGITHENMQDSSVEEINEMSKKYFKGEFDATYPPVFKDPKSVIWTREYDGIPQKDDSLGAYEACKQVKAALDGLAVQRIAVGHTVQLKGEITSRCNKMVFMIDIGMSKGINNRNPEVLQIMNDAGVSAIGKRREHHFAAATNTDYSVDKSIPSRLDEDETTAMDVDDDVQPEPEPREFKRLVRGPRSRPSEEEVTQPIPSPSTPVGLATLLPPSKEHDIVHPNRPLTRAQATDLEERRNSLRNQSSPYPIRKHNHDAERTNVWRRADTPRSG